MVSKILKVIPQRYHRKTDVEFSCEKCEKLLRDGVRTDGIL
jgi:hypothetical protein